MTDAEDPRSPPGEVNGDGDGDGDGPKPMGWWEMLEDDVAETAAEYESEGWETLALHTADVTPLDGSHGDDVGLSVLVPDDEFEALRATLEDARVDRYEVYRTEVMGYVALLVVLETDAENRAVLFPAYYAPGDDAAEAMFEQAASDGEVTVFLRTLAGDRVAVTLTDPDLLAPPAED